MIANVTRGTGFRGLINYLCDDAKGYEIVGGNIAGQSPRQIAAEFAATREANTAVKTAVWHCSLSSPPGERLSDERWNDVGTTLLTKVGLGADRPYLIIRHQDRDHDHVHVVTSRTDYAGNIWDGGWEVRRVLKAKSEIETEFGLTPTPVGGAGGPKIGAGQMRRIARALEDGRDLELDPRGALARHIDGAISASGGDGTKFAAALSERGIGMTLNKSKTTGRVAGACFSLDGSEWLKGSQLGPAYSWTTLQKRIAVASLNPAPKNEIVGIETGNRAPVEHRTTAGVPTGPAGGSHTAPGGHADRVAPWSNSGFAGRAVAFPRFAVGHAAGAGDGAAGIGPPTHRGDQRPRSPSATHAGSHFLTALARLPRLLSLVSRTVASFTASLGGEFFGTDVAPDHKRARLHGPQLF